jgi:hypothetical protein
VIAKLTGLQTTALKPTVFTKSFSDWRSSPAGAPVEGAIPGSSCLWDDPNPPWGTAGISNVAWVQVGYGESAKDWAQYAALQKSDGVTLSSLAASQRQLSFGGGAEAFLETASFASYAVPPPFPHDLYVVALRTKHGDVIQAAFMTLSLAATEQEIRAFLERNPSF